MKSSFLGIDIAKETFYVALNKPSNSPSPDKPFSKEFKNQPAGFRELLAWLKSKKAEGLHACMEATGHYGEKLAAFLYEQGLKVSVVNPLQIKAFGKSELLRTKTDKADAGLIMRYLQSKAALLSLWQPPAPHIQELKSLNKRRDDVQQLINQEENRREGIEQSVLKLIDRSIEYHRAELKEIDERLNEHIDHHPDLKHKKELLESIPCVAERTIAVVLSFMTDDRPFKEARQVSAYVGLNPQIHQSGISVNRREHISKKGDSRLRKALYMPAISAMRHNPIIKAFCERLRKNGKSGKVLVVAAMKKLLYIIFGVLKNNQPFNPNWSHA